MFMPVEIRMPSLDPSMTEARVVKWHKAAGDPVEIGESIVEIETDKAVVDVESEAQGVLAEILVAEGDYAAVNATIGVILEAGQKAPAVTPTVLAPGKATPEGRLASVPAGISVVLASNGMDEKDTSAMGNRLFASPLARRLAALEDLDLSELRGSGPNGRIVKCDVEAALAEKSTRPYPRPKAQSVDTCRESSGLPDYERISNSAMRNTIARRLTESSRDIPHYFLTMDCELDKVLALRREVNETAPEEQKVSLNDFIIRAVALALKKVPAANAAWSDTAILRFRQADISIAVAVDGGLITPVIRHADAKNLLQIAVEARDLASRARAGRLRPEEYKGGTFTISNLGMFGIKSFTSIINPPQSAILSVGAGEQRPVVKAGQIGVATIMTLTLAVDHRCIDGAVGAEFLARFKQLIEQPIALLL
jgi:pyruvate dehydrogenase E2 component (dihydrolipoamide acetyltransferase)